MVMVTILCALGSIFEFRVRSRASLELELVALRHQVTVPRRQRPGRPQLSSLDRLLWVWLYRVWPQVIDAMILVKPATVVQWHRKGFTQDWLSCQMTEASPWDTAPRYLLRDRDKSYGPAFRHRARAMGITEVITAARSLWQNPYVERLIGSIRRECLDHVIVLNERHLRRVHLSLDKDCPRPRNFPPQATLLPSRRGGGLHHRYERRAA